MQIQTLAGDMLVANPGGNSTAGSIVEPAAFSTATSSDPSKRPVSSGVVSVGDGVIECGGLGSDGPNGLFIIPYAVGSAANTFTLKVYGWKRSYMGASPYQIWVPPLLATFTCTTNTQAGVANTPVDASQLFCGTIALVTGNANVSNEILSPTGNVMASILLDVKGCRFVEFRYAIVGTITSMNALVARI